MIVIYTNKFIPEKFAATTYGPVVLIRPKYKNDKGLLEHEKVHVWQWVMSFGLHSLLYKFSKKYRLEAEVCAYKEQIKYYSVDNTELFAEFIASKYDLDISKDEAVILLRKE